MITYSVERPSEVLDEIKPLLEMHWREIAHYQDIPLDPDYEFYLTSPIVRVFTARDDGLLVGYGVFFVHMNRHYRKSKQAVQDILFVHPDFRGTTAGYRLIRYCDAQLKAEGCQVVYQHMKTAHQFGPLLERLGYGLVDLIHAKRLDKE
jgi:GNAT superfamily N-acetyltransferase